MTRKWIVAGFVLTLVSGVARAEDVKGKFRSATADSIVLKVKKEEKTFSLKKDVKVQSADARGKKATLKDLAGGATKIESGASVVLSTETLDDRQVVTKVLVQPSKKEAAASAAKPAPAPTKKKKKKTDK